MATRRLLLTAVQGAIVFDINDILDNEDAGSLTLYPSWGPHPLELHRVDTDRESEVFPHNQVGDDIFSEGDVAREDAVAEGAVSAGSPRNPAVHALEDGVRHERNVGGAPEDLEWAGCRDMPEDVLGVPTSHHNEVSPAVFGLVQQNEESTES